MPVKNPDIEITPYQYAGPTVPMPNEIQGQTTPAPPLQGQFGKKGTGALAIGDAILKGVMLGHQEKEQRKAAQAQATLAAADKATEGAYQSYQDALSTAGGNVNDPKAKAAYDAYVGIFNQSKETKAKFVIPEKDGKKKDSTGKGKDKKPGFVGGIKEFFEANPHVVPQIALMTMQPKAPGFTQETRLQNAEVTAAEAQAKAALSTQQHNEYEMGQEKEADQRAALQRQVESSGGVESVLADKKATPELQQAARQMKYEALDKMDPMNKLKMGFVQDIQSGQNKTWTPEQRMLAGALGVVPQPQLQTVTGKNGHQQQILVDPLSNQPVPGSKPLDLGPPQWAQEFYAKRAADKSDLRKAVASDPTAYGVRLTGNPQQDKAAKDARTEELFVRQEFGIQSLADLTQRTGFEIQRDNQWLIDVMKAAGLNAKAGASPLDSGQVTMSYPIEVKGQDGKPIPAGKQFSVGRDYFNKMLDEFTIPASEGSGVRAFRDTPKNPDGKAPEVLDAERRFISQWVSNQMTSQKGKAALSPQQADAILKQTALGIPIMPPQKMTPPPSASGNQTASGAMTRPPAGPTKMYIVPGYPDPVELTDEEAAKAKAANIPIEDASTLMQQFSQQ
jgi:hypothetical protein